jgi:signal transduction histidine kinase
MLEDIAETMEPVIADAGCALELGRLEPVRVRGDADLFNQMIVNLLENVVTHTPPGRAQRCRWNRPANPP